MAMRLDCEIISQEFLPVLRAVMAKELAACGLSQKEIAESLGISQPAVSQYLRDLRGSGNFFAADEELSLRVRDFCGKLKERSLGMEQLKKEMYSLCEAAMRRTRPQTKLQV